MSELTLKVLNEVEAERNRQDAKWGEQNHPSVDKTLTELKYPPERICEEYEIPTESRAKFMCDTATKRGELTFTHIVLEELSESVSCMDDKTRRGELIQLAAVVVSWIESIDRRRIKEVASSVPDDFKKTIK